MSQRSAQMTVNVLHPSQTTPRKSAWEERIVAALSAVGLLPVQDTQVASFIRSNGQLNFCYPDVTFPVAGTLVFLDGCYWHGCPDHYPGQNRPNDARTSDVLTERGWTVLRFWECQSDDEILLAVQLAVGYTSANGCPR